MMILNEFKKKAIWLGVLYWDLMHLPKEHNVWDKHSIKAAIARKGKSLSD